MKRSAWKFQENTTPPDQSMAVVEPQYNEQTKEQGYVEWINNRIYFYSDIDREKMLTFVKVLREREDEMFVREKTWRLNEVPTLHVHIHSYGGFAHAGFAGHDHIINSEVPIYTYVDGVAASAATLLSIAGTKRFIYRHAFILIHQAKYDYWGTFTHEEIKDAEKNAANLIKALKSVYLTRTKMKEEQLDQLLDHDLYLNAEQALEYGLVDEIVG